MAIEDRKCSEILERLGNDGWELVSKRTIGTTILGALTATDKADLPSEA